MQQANFAFDDSETREIIRSSCYKINHFHKEIEDMFKAKM